MPKSRDDYEAQVRRVAAILGEEDEELPEVSEAALGVYHDYLARHLKFPFNGEYRVETGPFRDKTYRMNVTGLVELADGPDDFEFYGLFCEGRETRRHVVVPLGELEVDDEASLNFQLIGDYRSWFWNHR